MNLHKSEGLLLPGGPAAGVQRNLLLGAMYAGRLISRRRKNLLACQWDKRRPSPRLSSIPSTGIVEVATRCVRRCPCCPTGR